MRAAERATSEGAPVQYQVTSRRAEKYEVGKLELAHDATPFVVLRVEENNRGVLLDVVILFDDILDAADLECKGRYDSEELARLEAAWVVSMERVVKGD